MRSLANESGAHILLTGIRPTLRKPDLELCHMTQRPRYFVLNETLRWMCGDAFEFSK